MKLPELTQKRRELLANFCLNVVVISFGVAIYEHNWLGLPAIIVFMAEFLYLTKE